jgi:hypothetical protein
MDAVSPGVIARKEEISTRCTNHSQEECLDQRLRIEAKFR